MSVKEKLVEAVIDIGKTCVYVGGGFILLHFIDDNIVYYLEKVERVKALREASLEYKTEEMEASSRLVRASKRLQYSVYVLENTIISLEARDYEDGYFRESAEEFLFSLRYFLSYSTDSDLRESATALSKSIDTILVSLSERDLSDGMRKKLKIDLILLNSSLSKFVLKLTR